MAELKAGSTVGGKKIADIDITPQDIDALPVNGKAVDADKLDGLNSTQFVRSDTGTILDARLPNSISSSITGNAATATNADKLDNLDSTQFVRSDTGTILDARLPNTITSSITGNAATATNADKLDGQHGSYYQNAGNLNAGTIPDARLPNSITSNITGNAATATNADKLDGLNSTQFARTDVVSNLKINSTINGVKIADINITPQDIGALPADGKSVNSNLLDGLDSTKFVRSDTGTILDARLPNSISSSITGNAATATNAANADNADKLDGKDSTQFLRSDIGTDSNIVTITGNVINCALGNVYYKSLSSNWNPSFLNVPDNRLYELFLILINGGNHVINFTPNINWVLPQGGYTTNFNNTPYSFMANGTKDFVHLWTYNSGATFFGKVMR